MTERLQSRDGEIAESEAERVLALASRQDAVVVGPGLGLGAGAARAVEMLARSEGAPAVFDADALTLLARNPQPIHRRAVITPHPGEMARLLATSSQSVQAARIRRVREAAERYGAVTLLKGAHTLIASPSGALGVNLTGNAGLATAGAGDVLSGVIGAWLARGVAPFEAAAVGAWAHGLAADLAAESVGEEGFVAREVADYIPDALAHAAKPE
jgi:NAD(P)H-hydrate epimerase